MLENGNNSAKLLQNDVIVNATMKTMIYRSFVSAQAKQVRILNILQSQHCL